MKEWPLQAKSANVLKAKNRELTILIETIVKFLQNVHKAHETGIHFVGFWL
ncbi:hypothetical protein FD01_GL000614 [Lacticaseibacillus manihotivorans DSM 13343 = JCM 12514]|uniref:Uncharacterized protein n=1 Tax=Lacticaseibacillus manihotivorans DSM 13343 = JCM 12514 TaxID=1423769 RepID=A0A0R1QM93_9LACO|nr:hypothetical protein FD01_GL000614 [Lacticaseibacillus manihotivorans DSM 13343 = JCM 12514]